MPPTLVTVGELAAYLKSTPASLYRALRLGKLHGVKVGTQWRIDLEELQNSLVIQFDSSKDPDAGGTESSPEAIARKQRRRSNREHRRGY